MKKILLPTCLIFLSLFSPAQSPRLSLYEEFTGENCGPCAAVNPGLDALLALPTNTSKCVAIKWQVPIPSAPSSTWSLYQTNKTEIDWRYSPTSVGGYGYGISSAPTGKMDGQNVTVFGATSDNPGNLTSGVITTAQSYTSAFTINMLRNWDANCTAVNLTITINATANFNATGNLIFRTVMVERHIHFPTPPGTNGETTFEDAVIKSFPTLQGGTLIASSWTTGQTQTFTLNCPIPSYIRNKAEIAFVGFIQDDGNRKVAQAGRCEKQSLPNDAKAVPMTPPVVCNPTFNPVAAVKNNGLNPITNFTVTGNVDGISASPAAFSGNLAPGATTMVNIGVFTKPSTNGPHTFSFTINAINATDFDLSNNSAKITFAVASTFSPAPITEGFVSNTFPPTGFTNINPNAGPGWSRVSSSGLGGYGLTPESAKHDFYTNPLIGDKDEFILPPMDLSGNNTPYLLFDIAYAQRTLASNDKLEIFASDNCGANWNPVFSKSGQSLTIVPPYDGSEYFPGSSEWRTEVVSLEGFNKSNVLVKFVTTNGNGNNLYLDNINLSMNSPVGLAENKNGSLVDVYPNPAQNKAYLKINTGSPGFAKVVLVNTMGQMIYQKETSLIAGTNLIEMKLDDLVKGVYSIIISSEKEVLIKKIMVE